MSTIDNNPAHQAAMAAIEAEKRQRNANALATGFWAGVVIGGASAVALVVTYLMYHAH